MSKSVCFKYYKYITNLVYLHRHRKFRKLCLLQIAVIQLKATVLTLISDIGVLNRRGGMEINFLVRVEDAPPSASLVWRDH